MNPRRLQSDTIFSINSPVFGSAIGGAVSHSAPACQGALRKLQKAVLDCLPQIRNNSRVRVIERFFSGVPHPHLLGVYHPSTVNTAGWPLPPSPLSRKTSKTQ